MCLTQQQRQQKLFTLLLEEHLLQRKSHSTFVLTHKLLAEKRERNVCFVVRFTAREWANCKHTHTHTCHFEWHCCSACHLCEKCTAFYFVWLPCKYCCWSDAMIEKERTLIHIVCRVCVCVNMRSIVLIQCVHFSGLVVRFAHCFISYFTYSLARWVHLIKIHFEQWSLYVNCFMYVW